MFTVARMRIGSVNRGVALWRQVVRLGQGRPMCKKRGLTPVQFAYLLQAHDVSIELFHRVA